MSLCERCSVGEFHGYPPKGSPLWEVGTVYFWCPFRRNHYFGHEMCTGFVRGTPRRYDKHGRLME